MCVITLLYTTGSSTCPVKQTLYIRQTKTSDKCVSLCGSTGCNFFFYLFLCVFRYTRKANALKIMCTYRLGSVFVRFEQKFSLPVRRIQVQRHRLGTFRSLIVGRVS